MTIRLFVETWLPPNQRFQLTPLRVDKIGRLLLIHSTLTSFSAEHAP
jgi:hypothetical protein